MSFNILAPNKKIIEKYLNKSAELENNWKKIE